jgi:DNA-binding transcriptional ArsR family regulator
MKDMPQEALIEVADYFKVLSEPTRLQLLNILRRGERNVGDLTQECGFAIANISRHLAILTAKGLVSRESRGTSAFYKIADESVYDLCDLVCGNIARQYEKTAANKHLFLIQSTNAGGIAVATKSKSNLNKNKIK